MATPVLTRLAAVAITLPFLLALPSHQAAQAAGWNLGLWALITGVFLGARLAADRAARTPQGVRLMLAFATLYLTLGLLAFTSTRDYRFAQAATDLGLLYLAFFAAAAAARIAAPAGRALLALLVLALGLTSIVQAVHLHAFGFAIGPEGYRAILQSNPGEALEFGQRFLDTGVRIAAAAALGITLAAALGAPSLRLTREALGLAGACALGAVAILGANPQIVGARMQVFAEGARYVADIAEYRAVRAARSARGLEAAVVQEGPLAGRAQTYVFLIGESLTRNHMSLYGYWRDTTPALAGLAEEMAIFKDVVAPHSHTDPSLELVLTLANQANGLRFTDTANYGLIELLRSAGFTTWWISNQNSFGPWDNKVSVLASAADRVQYTGSRSGAMIAGAHDEALLEPFAAALADAAPRKAIFLHFLGNHWQYAARYPDSAAAFFALPGRDEIGALRSAHARLDLVNHYDNAVRYHDQLAARIIEQVRASGEPAVLALFADHGESLYEFKGHYFLDFTRDHVEVPLALWFSPQFARHAPQIVARARASAHLPFALEDLPHLVAGLAGLRGAGLEPQRSPLSSAYRAPAARPLFEAAMIYEQANDPILNTRRALERLDEAHPGMRGSVWAHRVDTLGKMMQAAGLFRGVEIDVVYDPRLQQLTVNHPPEPPSGLALDALLAYAGRLDPQLALWLDLKNLDEANAAQVLEALDRLERRHAIRARALVETSHPGPAAALLRNAGYSTSYYLPTALVTRSRGSDAASDCDGADELRRLVLARRFAAVSYDWRGHAWVERCLDGFLREHGLRRYAWDLEPILSDPGVHEALLLAERLSGYEKLAAVLLPFRSPFDDWR